MTPIDEFLQELHRQQVSPHTSRNYGLDLSHFSRWFETTNREAFSAAAVTPTDIREYKSYLLNIQQPPAKPATVNRRLAALRKFFSWVRATGLIVDNVASDIKGVEEQKLAPRGLDRKEIYRLLRAVERDGSKRDVAIVQVLRHTGLRLGDITLSDRSRELRVRHGKGSKERAVPLNAEARRAIRSYLEARPTSSDDHLFLGNRGTGLTANSIYDVVITYARLAGLEDVSPHTLRHTLARNVLDAGAQLVNVAALLGHKRLDTTAVYTQPSQRDLEKAVERISAD